MPAGLPTPQSSSLGSWLGTAPFRTNTKRSLSKSISNPIPDAHLRRNVWVIKPPDRTTPSQQPRKKSPMPPEPTPGAMNGLRVIDLTRVLGGPYCTQILADHGADVIKVEPPAGDEVRDWGPPFHGEDAAYFVGINRNKRSIGLDLASEGGRAVLLKMLERADVLIENFKPGTLDKWGIGNDVLRAKFPKLVHCRISGFGADGPRGGNPGYDAIIQAMTGMIKATGSPQSGP